MKTRALSSSAVAEELRITEGGRLLRDYLSEIEQSVPDFCEENDLDRIQVQRVMNGDRWKRISVDFADAIDKATDGRVGWRTFRSSTARAVKKAA